MFEFPYVASAASLVSAAISSAKNARDIAKDSSDHALKAAISELYDDLLNVKERVLALDEENRLLKQQILTKDEIVGPVEPHGYFFKKDDMQKPLCPKCLQSQPSNAVYLSAVHRFNTGQRRKCIICDFTNMEERGEGSSFSVRSPRRGTFNRQ